MTIFRINQNGAQRQRKDVVDRISHQMPLYQIELFQRTTDHTNILITSMSYTGVSLFELKRMQKKRPDYFCCELLLAE